MKIPHSSMGSRDLNPPSSMRATEQGVKAPTATSRFISAISRMARTAVTEALKVALRYNERLVAYNQPGASYEFTSDRGAMHSDSPKAPTMRGR